MGKTDLFTQFYPTGFTQWVKLTMPTLTSIIEGVWFGDQLAVFRPNFVQNCGFRFCIQNAKFLDFVRFSSKTNFLCPYTWHHRHCQQLTSHNCRVSGAGKMVSTPTTVQMVRSTVQSYKHPPMWKKYIIWAVIAGHTHGTAGEVIRLTCSCPKLIVKDERRRDRWRTDVQTLLRIPCWMMACQTNCPVGRRPAVYPGLSHLMTDIAITLGVMTIWIWYRISWPVIMLRCFLLGFEQL